MHGVFFLLWDFSGCRGNTLLLFCLSSPLPLSLPLPSLLFPLSLFTPVVFYPPAPPVLPPIFSPFLSLPTSPPPLSPVFPPSFPCLPWSFFNPLPSSPLPLPYLRPLFISSPLISSPSLPPPRSPSSLLIRLFHLLFFLFPAPHFTFSHSHYLSVFLLIPHATPPSMRLKDIRYCKGMKRSSMYSVYDSLRGRFPRFQCVYMSINEDSRLQGLQRVQILNC